MHVRAHTVPLPGLSGAAPPQGPGLSRAPLRALASAVPHGLRDHAVSHHAGPTQLLPAAEAGVRGPAEELQSHRDGPAEEDEEDAEHDGAHEEADRADLREPGGDG